MGFALLNRLGAQDRFDHILVLLSVPQLYLYSISSWPLRSMMMGLASLPSGYVTLLCCLVLEQSSELLAAVTMAQTSTTRPEATAQPLSPPPQLALATLKVTLCTLVMGLGKDLDRILEQSQGALIHVFVTPAVIQTYKRIMLMYAEEPRIAALYQPNNTAPALTNLLVGVLNLKFTASQHLSPGSYLQTLEGRGAQLLPHLRPSVSFSDVALPQAVFAPVSPGLG